jgi:sugar phosphate isomerase/epimerase
VKAALETDRALFGVSEFTHWFQTFEQDILLYKQAGADSIEVCERKLARDPMQSREQLAFLKSQGLPVSSVQPRVHALFQDFMCPELADPVERMREFRKTIDLFSEFFPEAPLVTIGGMAPQSNYRLAHRTARKLYSELADYAAARGMRIMYEPLHPILMNTDTFICTLKEARMLVDAVNRENFGLCLDVWHVWQEPLIEEQIQALGDWLFGVHVSDWPVEEPRCVADRLLPGDGCIPLPALLRAIEKTGYQGPYCLEIFSDPALPDSLWRQDPVQVIERGRRGFYNAWKSRARAEALQALLPAGA